MANMYNINDLTYQPSTNMDWFTKSVFGGKLIEKGKITPVIGVKESTKINLIDIAGNILQADDQDCAWTPEQIAKLSEKELKIKTYKINLEQCLNDLERKRTIWMMSPGAKNQELPDSLEEATMMLLAVELSNEIETKIFSGDSSTNPKDFDGVLKVLKDSLICKKEVGTALTTANILGEIGKAFVRVPEAILNTSLEKGTLNMYISYSSLMKVKLALGGVSSNNVIIQSNVTIEGETIKYMGAELVPVKGIGENDIIIADAANLLLGTDLLSDLEEMRLGQFPAPHDNKIFIDGRLRLGFVIPFEDEVVFYSPTVTAPQGRMAKTVTAPTEGTGLDLSTFDISLSESKMKPYVAQATDVTLLESWLALEQAKEQPRSGVTTLFQNRINELSNNE